MSSPDELIKELQTLNDISLTLNKAVDVRSALSEALSRLMQLMDLEAGWIFLRDSSASDKLFGAGYTLVAHANLPPALALDNPMAWSSGCDCQSLCNTDKLIDAYNEVRCSRLAAADGERKGLRIHA